MSVESWELLKHSRKRPGQTLLYTVGGASDMREIWKRGKLLGLHSGFSFSTHAGTTEDGDLRGPA